jgi:protein-S-isoprenylcysteine O-methyltransferase Ste14
MAPTPYSDVSAAVAFFVPVAVFVGGEEFLIIRALVRREGTRADSGTHLLSAGGVAAGVGGAFALAGTIGEASLGGARWAAYAAGLALMVVGLALRWWSIRALGRSFTVDLRIRAGQTVTDTGPYRWVRHPSYTGLLLICAGIGLALGNGAALACAILIPLAGLVARIHTEERVLLRELGDPYRLFSQGRARLIPGVW